MYKIKSYDALILHNFERIKSGKYFDDNYHPYTKEFLEKMIQYFIQREEYENCDFLKKHIDMRFSHDFGFFNSIKND
jgi:hypothetical protein